MTNNKPQESTYQKQEKAADKQSKKLAYPPDMILEESWTEEFETLFDKDYFEVFAPELDENYENLKVFISTQRLKAQEELREEWIEKIENNFNSSIPEVNLTVNGILSILKGKE